MWIYLSPHLDDVVYSCGGRISAQVAAGEDVAIWSLFAGDPPPGPLSEFARLTLQRSGAAVSVEARREEDRRSSARLGAVCRHFSYSDALYRDQRIGGQRRILYTSLEMLKGGPLPDDRGLLRKIIDVLVRELPPGATLVCPLAFGDHVDHRLARSAAEEAFRRRRAAGDPLEALWYYADFPYAARSDAINNKIIGGQWEFDRLELRREAVEAWQHAILDHESQLRQLWGDARAMRQAIDNDVALRGGAILWRRKPAFDNLPHAKGDAPRVLMLPHQRGRISPRRPMGGGPTTFFELAASLRRAGAEVTVLAALDEDENYEHEGVCYYSVHQGQSLDRHLSFLSIRCFDIVLSQRADFLLLAMGHLPLARGLLRVIDSNLEGHNCSPEEINRRIDWVLAVSGYVKNLLVDWGVSEGKVSVVHEGLKPGVFRRLPEIHRDENRVLFAGATVRLKGLHILVAAMDLLHAEGVDAKLEIHGSEAIWSGFSETTDWQKISASRPYLDYRGISDQSTLVEAYNRATLCVVPTDPARLQEGLGRVSLEAQACGCPAIVSRSGGLPETVVPGKTGVVVDPLTPATLAAAIKRLLADKATLKRMSAAAAQRAGRLTMDEIAAAILKVSAGQRAAARQATIAERRPEG